MKNISILLFFSSGLFGILSSSISIKQELPAKLQGIPDGINVSHNKQIVYAIKNQKDPKKYGKYKWQFETTVSSLSEELTITEFGAFVLSNGKWVQKSLYNRPFNSQEFAKWYSCEDAILQKGKSYTDHNNWSKANVLNGKKTLVLWYFIGKNKDEVEFKGIAQVITIGALETQE